MQTKNSRNAMPPPSAEAIAGKIDDTTAANTQCVRLPNDWPRPRIRFGKISEMNTQITEP
jgi:hypothetical protein